MHRLLIALLTACAVLLVNCPLCAERIIATFPFSPPPSWVHPNSRLRVGPEGDIWFILSEPLRLMRIHESQLECMHEMPIYDLWDVDVAISPDGTIYIGNFQYEFTMETGITETGITRPSTTPTYYLKFAQLDGDGRMFCVYYFWNYDTLVASPFNIYELHRDASFECRMSVRHIASVIAVCTDEFWIVNAYHHPHYYPPASLMRLNLDTGQVEERHSDNRDELVGLLCARDYEGRLWMASEDITVFDGEEFSTFAQHDPYNREAYTELSIAADRTIWAVLAAETGPGIVRFTGDERRVFNTDDGLLTDGSPCPPAIDYDGNVWIVSTYQGISMISDGGWPPMRLMLHRMETPGSIAVEAQVINNGPVVGVDVYVALELNGQLLFWPSWQPTPCPVQVNLRPGHNQTATIISAPRSNIPPGAYTFWACMTGRGTQKLIGPLDRKFETLTVEVD